MMALSMEELQIIKRSPLVDNALEFQEFAEAIAVEFGVTLKQVKSMTRGKPVIAARQMICFLAHRRGFSYPEIGRYLGRDHSSAMVAAAQAAQIVGIK